MNSHALHFDLFWKKWKYMKKYLKKETLWHVVLLCVLVSMKNDKLDFCQHLQKKTSQKGLSPIDMYKFQAKWQRYCHSHDIVCDKVTILDTYVCLGMGNNGTKVFFQIIFINTVFHFQSAKIDFFREASTKNMLYKVIYMMKKMIWMSYLDSSHFSTRFRYFIC